MNALLMAVLLALPTPGLYHTATGAQAYLGVEHDLPDAPAAQAYEPASRRLIDAPDMRRWRLKRAIREQRATVKTPQGALGVSLYHSDDRKRAAVVLVHGNDPETREMGFLIPYFVLHGINVISYDQRGTGTSAGNWQMSGPGQRAIDADAIIDTFASNKLIDRKRVGVWGFQQRWLDRAGRRNATPHRVYAPQKCSRRKPPTEHSVRGKAANAALSRKLRIDR